MVYPPLSIHFYFCLNISFALRKYEKQDFFIFFVLKSCVASFSFLLIAYLFFFNCYREMDLLSIPSNAGSLRLVQWPLFLLSSKV
jgi:hypothetical protein